MQQRRRRPGERQDDDGGQSVEIADCGPADELGEADLAAVIYQETGGLRPAWAKGSAKKTEADYDPKSVEALKAAREAIGHVVQKRRAGCQKGGVAKAVPPTAEELKNPNTKSIWEACQAAAKQVQADRAARKDPVNCAKNFYLRTGNKKPGWAKGAAPSQSFGPFRNPAGGGDVPKGADDVHVDIYQDIV